MREDRNFKASDVSGPSIWIFILWLSGPSVTDLYSVVIVQNWTTKIKYKEVLKFMIFKVTQSLSHSIYIECSSRCCGCPSTLTCAVMT
jgi:hypothetical protein